MASTRSLGVLTIDMVANIGGFVEGMSQAERETEKLTRAEKRQYESLQRLVGAIDPVLGRMNQLADQQRKLQQAFDKGLIDKQVFDQLSSQIANTRRELEATTPAAKALAAAQDALVANAQALDSEGYALVQSLQAQISAFGKSADAIQLERAARLGVLQTVQPLVGELSRLRDVKEREEETTRRLLAGEQALGRARQAISAERISQLHAEQRESERLREAELAARREAATSAFTDGGPVYSRANINEASQVREVAQERERLANIRRAELIAENNSIQLQERLTAVLQRKEKAARDAAEAERTTASDQAFLKGLERQIALYGKATSEVIAYDAAQRGLSAQAAPLIARLKATEGSLGRTGITAKQTQLALMGLPAQFSDIFVSLQGGQAPLTVFLQQGLQIRDMFGGFAAAAKAVGSQLLALAANPLVLAAAAVAALGVAFVKANQEAEAFTKALILTGNASATTAGELGKAAKRLDELDGTTTGEAAKALALVAGNAAFAGQNIELVARSALKMENATGKAVEDTVKEFERLAKEPAKASQEYDKLYNYLTLEQLRHVKRLEDEGKAQEAVTEAFRLYAGMVDERTPKLVENVNAVAEQLRYAKGFAKELADSFLDIFRPRTQVQEWQRQLEKLQMRGRTGIPLLDQNTDDEIARLQKLIATREAADKKEADRARDTLRLKQQGIKLDELAEARKKLLQNNEEKRLKALADYQKEIDERRARAAKTGEKDPELDPKKIEENIRRINKLYETKVKKEKAFQDDAGTRMLMDLREQEAVLRGQVGLEDKLVASRKELLKFEQQITDLKSKKQLTDDQKAILAKEKELRAQLEINAALEESQRKETIRDDAATKMLAKIREESAVLAEQLETGKKQTQQAKDLVAFEEQIKQLRGKSRLTDDDKDILAREQEIRANLEYNKLLADRIEKNKELIRLEQFRIGLRDKVDAFKESADSEVFGAGLGPRERKQQEERLAIQRDFLKERARLDRDYADQSKGLSQENYKQQVADLEAARDEMLGISREKNAQMLEEMRDPLNGLKTVFNELKEEADNFAGRTEEAMNTIVGAFGSAVDAGSDLAAQHILWGTSTKEALKGVAREMLTDTLSSLIQLGTKQIWYYGLQRAQIGLTAATAQSAAVQTAQVQAAANTEIAATAAPAAAATSLASFGANAALAIAGIAAVYGLTKAFSSGGRAAGGNVDPGKMYEVGEYGRPELLRMGGKSYLLPGNKGGYVLPATPGVATSMSPGASSAAMGSGWQIVNNVPGIVFRPKGNLMTVEMGDDLARLVYETTVSRVAGDITDGDSEIGRNLSGRFGNPGGFY